MEINKIKDNKNKILGKNILFFERIDSTQKYIKENIENLSSGTIVLADEQIKGKGTKGRCWYSGKGLNIAMSILVKPNCFIQKIDHLTVDIAKIIQKVIQEMYGYSLMLKEPNDLLLKNKKIAGILTESQTIKDIVKSIIIGIGFNVNEIKFDSETEQLATSLKKEYNMEFERESIIKHVLEKLEESMREKGILG